MLRGGLRGIREILSTISNFSKRIPIGADTEKVSVMTRIFMNNTIVARAEGGRKDSRVAPLLQPNQRDGYPPLLKWPRVRDRDRLLLK
jgi:hypothetical protein